MLKEKLLFTHYFTVTRSYDLNFYINLQGRAFKPGLGFGH
jgi:hypothetical protein